MKKTKPKRFLFSILLVLALAFCIGALGACELFKKR